MIKNIQALLQREQGLLSTRKNTNEKRINCLTEFEESYEASKNEESYMMLVNS